LEIGNQTKFHFNFYGLMTLALSKKEEKNGKRVYNSKIYYAFIYKIMFISYFFLKFVKI